MKTLIAFLLLGGAALAQTVSIPGLPICAGAVTTSCIPTANSSGVVPNPVLSSPVILNRVVSTLPTGLAMGSLAYVTDGSTVTDCTIGGGSNKVLCAWNGAAWAFPGGSGGGGGGGGGITTQSVNLGAAGTAVRAVNTIYHNIFSVTGATGPIFVSFSCGVLTTGVTVNLQMVTDSSSTPTQQVSIYQKVGFTSVGDVDSVSGWVLPGNYYEVHDYAANCDPANFWWTEWF